MVYKTSLMRSVASSNLADWIARSTAAGVTFASDFSGAADFTLASTNGGTGRVFGAGMSSTETDKVTKDTTDGLTNGCCLKILKPSTEATGSAEWMFPFNAATTLNSDSFGLGVPFWIQHRIKLPGSTWFVPSNCGGNQQARKILNIAQYSPTNTASQSFANTFAQIVITEQDTLGIPVAYHRDTVGSYPSFLGSPGGLSGGGIFKTMQNAIDRGSGTHDVRYCEVPSPYDTASAGCEPWPMDEWFTMMYRILPASYSGGTGNQFDMYMARAGVYTWTHLISEVDFELGDPNSEGGGFTGLNGGHFLTYESQRIDSTVDTYTKFDQVIVSLNEIAIPLDSGVP